jgi:N-acetylglutamate synthase-like GNAT family acetyltransferase
VPDLRQPRQLPPAAGDVPFSGRRSYGAEMTISSDFIVRPATQDDVPALEAFIEPFVREGKLLPRTRSELDELITHGFVAERTGALAGFAALEIYSSKLGEIRSLAVLPELQGQGIGRRLVAACVERARDRHVLEVMAITSSDGFFRTCGFDFTLPGERKALFIQTREER